MVPRHRRETTRPVRPRLVCSMDVTVATHSGIPRSRGLPSTVVEPDRWEGDVVLTDGGTVHVRPIRPDDAERLDRLPRPAHRPESIYFRFFSPKPRLTRQGGRAVHHGRHRRPRRPRRACSATTSSPWPATTAGPAGTRPRSRSPSTTSTTAAAWPRCCSSTSPPSARPTASTASPPRSCRTTGRMLGVFRPGRLRGPQRVLGRGHRRRLRHRPRPRSTSNRSTGASSAAESRSIARLMRPRSVAVIGASDRQGSVGRDDLPQPAERRLRRARSTR